MAYTIREEVLLDPAQAVLLEKLAKSKSMSKSAFLRWAFQRAANEEALIEIMRERGIFNTGEVPELSK
jgi:hypothetical protein